MVKNVSACLTIEQLNATSWLSAQVIKLNEATSASSLVGYLDVASATLLVFPGMWAISNFQGRVRCLSRKRREFEISSRVRSPSTLTRGLWSVTIRRLSQPWVKYLVCSKLHATARASPSIAAYLCSAPCRNRDPTRVTFHPFSQQPGNLDSHRQCFWERKYPMPCLHQSGWRQVCSVISKISTPFLMASTMRCLDSLNLASSSTVQLKGQRGLKKTLKRSHEIT